MTYVYKHTFPNGKVYIGIADDYYSRWNNGCGYKDNAPMYEDIKKYGWNGITHEILKECDTRKEAEQLEQRLIIAYRSEDFTYGYNRTKFTEHLLTLTPKNVGYNKPRSTKKFTNPFLGEDTDIDLDSESMHPLKIEKLVSINPLDILWTHNLICDKYPNTSCRVSSYLDCSGEVFTSPHLTFNKGEQFVVVRKEDVRVYLVIGESKKYTNHQEIPVMDITNNDHVANLKAPVNNVDGEFMGIKFKNGMAKITINKVFKRLIEHGYTVEFTRQ